MKKFERTRRNMAVSCKALPAFSLVLLGVLTACGESGVSGTSNSSAEAEGSGTSVSASQNSSFTLAPSLGAAQLASDNVATVQTAVTQASETGSEPVGTPAAATPVTIVNIPSSGTITDNTDTDGTDSTQSPDSSEPALSEQDSNSTSEPEQTPEVASTPDTDTSTDVTGEAEVQAEAEVEATPANTPEATAGTDTETSFNSVTTQGFDGEVLDDSIRITWPVLDTARGYNVYRQAEYYDTVYATEYVDTDVYDDDYYYEIQAFDKDDNYEYIATGLTVSARTFGRTDPDAPQPNNNILDNYELVFSDEFNGTELDTSKWNTSFLWGPDLIINSEEQYYVDIKNDPDFGFNPFTFDGEYMTINTIETPDDMRSKANNQPYLSGIITSYESMKFTYGYFETRAKFTHGRGYWPAFWLLNAYYGGADPEIDIMEFIGHNQDTMYHTYHYYDSNGELRSTKSFPVTGIDFTADFHTFGVEWKPGTIIFYVDNYETLRISDANVSQEEMYILVNTAVGGWWAGPPDFTTPFPGKYIIDYVRAYASTVQYDEIQFDQPNDIIPLFSDDPGQTTPNHKPPFWLWPEGYPNK